MSYYNEDYWMTDTPDRRVFALTYCEECSQRYMIRQWDPKLEVWLPEPEGNVYWRPLKPPPSFLKKEEKISKWIALNDE